MTDTTVLVVEDEQSIQALIRFAVEQAGYRCLCAASVREAQQIVDERLPDLLLIDWMLPDMHGTEWIAKLRSNSRCADLPVILLTARSSDEDKAHGLDLGADDYLTKPFSPRELNARINALLRRRAPQKTQQPIQLDELVLDPAANSLCCNGQTLIFSSSEFKLLHFFMTHPDRIYSRRFLLDEVWGDHVFIEERTVDVQIGRLRRQLQTIGQADRLQTIRGSGYRFNSHTV